MGVKPIRMRTHAKLNLFLRVVGARPDGFHEIETILHGISLGDDIEVSVTGTGEVEIELDMAEAGVGEPPLTEKNTVFIAANRLIELGATNKGISIRMVKRIPIGAGLGGGSGNAAGAIVALDELWAMKLSRMAMSEVAGLIGSDVPFCLEGGTALATARGEKLSPLPAPDKVWFVLGLSSVSLLTKDVYEAFDEMDSAPESSPSSMTLALGSGDVPEIAECLHNDLERAAFAMRPELAEKKRALLGAGALGAGMSGSGPTLFAIARDEGHARTIAAGVEDSFPSVVVTCSRATCIERLA